jgi:multidrug efflux pump subunit AcrA (membrane-fusion protein)
VGVGAAIDGVIQTIHVKEGQQVQLGDVLAELECKDLLSALRVANSKLESLQAGACTLASWQARRRTSGGSSEVVSRYEVCWPHTVSSALFSVPTLSSA